MDSYPCHIKPLDMQELFFCQDFEELFCPVTGQQVLFPYDYSPSPALLFIYIEEAEDFEYIIPEIKENFFSHFDTDGKTINGSRLYEKLKNKFNADQNKVLITFGICSTATFCFDYSYKRGYYSFRKT